MQERNIVVLTNCLSYAGPGVVAAVRAGAPCQLVCHDPNFASEAKREQFLRDFDSATVTSASTPEALIDEVVAQYGRIDALVSNDIGPAVWSHLEDSDAVSLREALEALVVRPFRLLCRASSHMKERRHGHIVLVTSAIPLRPAPGFLMYAAARAAASTMARAAAKELGPFNIQVNAVAPNYLESELYFPPEVWTTAKALEELRQNVPIGRLGTAREVGELIAFLISGRANFVTGEVINFAGGWS